MYARVGVLPVILSQLYVIVDAEVLAARGVALVDFASELRAAGVTLLQYRDKNGSPQEVLRAASILRDAFSGSDCRLILNDRADLAVLANFDGVHVGQGDLSPEDARRVVGPIASLASPPTPTTKSVAPTNPAPTTSPSAPSSPPEPNPTHRPSSASKAYAVHARSPRSRWSLSAASPAPTRAVSSTPARTPSP